jgi:hypothetical protein
MQLAASHIQIVLSSHQSHANLPAWLPVAYNINKINDNLSATGGHIGTICMRLVATRVQFECDWPTLLLEAIKQF